MPGIIFQTREAAATALVGVDLFRNEALSQSARRRVIRGIALIGGNAIAEASVRLKAGRVDLGTYYTTTAGAVMPIMPDDLQTMTPIRIAPGDRLSAIVVTAPTVSPIACQVFGDEL